MCQQLMAGAHQFDGLLLMVIPILEYASIVLQPHVCPAS